VKAAALQETDACARQKFVPRESDRKTLRRSDWGA